MPGTAGDAERRTLEEAVFDTVAALVVVLDRGGRIVRFNRACERATGYRADEVVGRFVFDIFVIEEERASVEKVFANLTPGHFPNRYENYWRSKAGKRIWIHWTNTAQVDTHGEIRYVIGTGIDLTQNVQLHQALGRAEARFKELVERFPDAVFVHHEGTIRYANAALAALLGYPRGVDLSGTRLDDVVAPDDRARVAARMRAIAAGEPVEPVELQLVAADRSLLPVEVSCIQSSFDDGVATVTVVRDMRIRRELTMRMVQADRTQMLGSIAAGVGHEINNPLSFIVGNLELAIDAVRAIGDEAADPRAVRRLVGEIAEPLRDALTGAERIAVIVRDLKGLSRTSEDAIADIAIEALLDSMLKVAANELKHRATVRREYGEVGAVRASEARLAQVFLNLLLNAAQAIMPGDAERNSITVRTSRSGDTVVVEVIDSGCGMTPDVLARAFEPFFTTKARDGTGLGLAISRQIIAGLGGAIDVMSTPQLGSTFRVRLPAATRTTVRTTDVIAVPALPASGQRRTVLVVDDEPHVARAIERLLRSSHDVVAVGSGLDALTYLTTSKAPSVILCDLMMPTMTGMELHRALAAHRPDLARRMVFMTGGAFTPESAAFIETSSRPLLDKPFTRQAVLELIERTASAFEP